VSGVAIRVEQLGKRYAVGRRRHRNLRDVLRRRRVESSSPESGFTWALRDVSFEVKHGETLGIVGANGAGKSTLLKILSRITAPTRGSVETQGRVGSLLEVGAGFHAELTGRENIFLNGAIVGMRKAEIARKFDEIVDFSGIPDFIDTPVKHYSSGMYVRLAFAVAAHLDHEIVLVDEVLAVGDAEFQRKCVSRMNEITGEGRTVLIVSHNLSTINRLCERTIWVERGVVREDGKTAAVVESYLSQGIVEGGRATYELGPDDIAKIVQIEILNSSGQISPAILLDRPACIRIRYRLRQPLSGYRLGIRVTTPDGFDVITSSTTDADARLLSHPAGDHALMVMIPARLLMPGRYLLTVFLGQPGVRTLDRRDNALVLQIHGKAKAYPERESGVIGTLLEWSFDARPAESVAR
jgi:ABC-type polysaccharide/polyol phosphate transport system ATPase subunit